MNKCAKCGSTNVSIERRINGYIICNDCNNKWKNNTVKETNHKTLEELGFSLKLVDSNCYLYENVREEYLCFYSDNTFNINISGRMSYELLKAIELKIIELKIE